MICYNRFPLQNRYPVLCERNFKVVSKVDCIQTYSIKFLQLSGRCIQFVTLTRKLLGLIKSGGIICRPNLIRWNESLLYINLFYIVLKRQCCLKMSNDNIICQNKLKILKTFLILCKLYTNIHCKKFNMPLSFNMIFDENFSNWCYFSCASPCC